MKGVFERLDFFSNNSISNRVIGKMSDKIDEIVISEARSVQYFFRGQFIHLICLAGLIAVTRFFASPYLGDASVLGLSDWVWFWLGIILGVLHQVYVWLGWRAQLGWGLLTKWFGSRDMLVFGSLFFPLVLTRPIFVLILGMADLGSMQLTPMISLLMGSIFLVPAVYTFWSVHKYFGSFRAIGGDHFRREFREGSLVQKGAFRWCSNAMYAFGLLFLWSLAFYTNSVASLALAIFHYAAAWVHYFCTEKPDMKKIYS